MAGYKDNQEHAQGNIKKLEDEKDNALSCKEGNYVCIVGKCGGKTINTLSIIERQTYLFSEGKVWRYYQNEVAASDGVTYTEIIFFDVTELYEKNLELREQTKQLEKISRDLKLLWDNVVVLIKEQEVLAAKTKLHDQMGAGVIAIRRIFRQEQTEEEIRRAVGLLKKAVTIMKNDNESSVEHSEFAEFMHDADTVGVKVKINR